MMFYGSKIRALEEENRDLRDRFYKLLERVNTLECDMKPYRIGERNIYLTPCEDTRPRVSLREVLDAVLDHLHLRVHQTQATPAVTMLVKAPTIKVKA